MRAISILIQTHANEARKKKQPTHHRLQLPRFDSESGI